MHHKFKSNILRVFGLGEHEHAIALKYRYLRRRLMRSDNRIFNAYLASHPSPKLHLGASSHLLPGWMNTDLEPGEGSAFLDATKPFPLPSERFDCVHAEHMIEHIPYHAGVGMLKECHRVLHPGGVVRIVTPDIQRLLDLGSETLSPQQQDYLNWMRNTFTPKTPEPASVFVINTFFRSWGHQFVYDEITLRGALLAAGFREIRRCSLGESPHPALRGIENVGRYPAGLLEFESIALEGVKSCSLGEFSG